MKFKLNQAVSIAATMLVASSAIAAVSSPSQSADFAPSLLPGGPVRVGPGPIPPPKLLITEEAGAPAEVHNGPPGPKPPPKLFGGSKGVTPPPKLMLMPGPGPKPPPKLTSKEDGGALAEVHFGKGTLPPPK